MNSDIGLFILRVVVGIVVIVHGYPKLKNWGNTLKWLAKEGFPLPFLTTAILALGETFGGLFLILGLFVVPSAIVVAVLMAGATLYDLRKNGWNSAEKALLLLAGAVCIILAGGGAWVLA